MVQSMPAQPDDRFHALFGHGRGGERDETPTPLLAAYQVLSDSDLDACIELSGDAPRTVSLLRAAKAERDVLDALDYSEFGRLVARHASARKLFGLAEHQADPLCRRLEACTQALNAAWEQQLRARGGRPLAMYSDEGNVALAQLLDTLAGLPAREAARRLSVGLRALARAGHGEAYDTAVSECIAAELEAMGFDYDQVLNGC